METKVIRLIRSVNNFLAGCFNSSYIFLFIEYEILHCSALDSPIFSSIFIRSKAESQAFNDMIDEPKNVSNQKENLIQILTDVISLDNNYNNLITELINNSKIVFSKLNVFRSSSSLLESELFNNKDILNQLLNTNRADNGQLLMNNLKKNVLISQNIILIIILISLLFIKKNN